MYAIVLTGGKQYKVEKDMIFKVEKIDAEAPEKPLHCPQPHLRKSQQKVDIRLLFGRRRSNYLGDGV